MKIISIIIIGFSIFGWSGCSKKTTGTTEKNETVSQSNTPAVKADSIGNNSRFIVSFYSTGEGAEGIQINAFEKYLADKSSKINKNIQFEKVRWGREGEVDFCLKLFEFSPEDQQKFIEETKAVLVSARRVHFSENAPCRRARK